jgi:hypothetical protein
MFHYSKKMYTIFLFGKCCTYMYTYNTLNIECVNGLLVDDI